MRQLTAYASYLDNLGVPLVGRARFYNFDDSPAVVYGLDNAHENYVQLGHIVYTNSSGQLVPQVFLDDHDYLVVFDKYIGGGTMAEDDDPESWQELGSAVDRYNTVGVTIDGNSLRTVGTIVELRSLHPITSVGEGETVTLLGYNSINDKPPINYRWNQYDNEADNGGSIIKVNDIATGRWEMVECPRYLDVRHFGAFPASTYDSNASQRYCIQLAGAYAHSNNCGIYFSGNSTNAYYDITGSELYDVDSDNSAMVFALQESGDTPATVKAKITGVKHILCISTGVLSTEDGRILLKDDVLKTSYAPKCNATLDAGRLLIIDSSFRSTYKTFENIVVMKHHHDDSIWTFNNCIVLYADERNDMACGDIDASSITTTGNAEVGGDLEVGGNLNLLPYLIEHDDTTGKLIVYYGQGGIYEEAFEFENGVGKFINVINMPKGWNVDNDNFFNKTGNSKHLSLKTDAELDLTAKNGNASDISLDKMQVTDIAKVRLLSTKIVSANEDGDSYSIRFDNGAYRNFFKVYTWDMSNAGSSYAFDLIPNFSTYDKFVLVVSWWWGSSNTKSEINQFVYLNGAGGKDVGEVICVENAGPRQHDYELSGLATNGDMKVFYDKSGNIFVLGARTDSDPAYVNKIIAVIPPFTSKNFILRDNGIWDPVEL